VTGERIPRRIEEYNAYLATARGFGQSFSQPDAEYACGREHRLVGDALGKPAEAAHYREKSMNYKNTLTHAPITSTRATRTGSWQKVFVPQ
jgi:hypothetical protein